MLNANNIDKILIKPNKYFIHFSGKNVDGFQWLFGGYGIGNIYSRTDVIEVCEIEHSTDYKIISEWIEKNKNS